MHTVEIIHPKTGEIIETKSFYSRYEAEMYGQQYQKFVDSMQHEQPKPMGNIN